MRYVALRWATSCRVASRCVLCVACFALRAVRCWMFCGLCCDVCAHALHRLHDFFDPHGVMRSRRLPQKVHTRGLADLPRAGTFADLLQRHPSGPSSPSHRHVRAQPLLLAHTAQHPHSQDAPMQRGNLTEHSPWTYLRHWGRRRRCCCGCWQEAAPPRESCCASQRTSSRVSDGGESSLPDEILQISRPPRAVKGEQKAVGTRRLADMEVSRRRHTRLSAFENLLA